MSHVVHGDTMGRIGRSDDSHIHANPSIFGHKRRQLDSHRIRFAIARLLRDQLRTYYDRNMTRNLGIIDDLTALSMLLDWEGKHVLDVGCGGGHLCRGLAELGAIAHGCEPDPVQAEKNRHAEPCDGVTLTEARAEDLPVASDAVDVVLLSRSLHHVPPTQMDSALGEARRVLKSSGVLLVFEPDMHGQFSQLIRPFHDESECRAQALDALERQGSYFESVEEMWFTTAFAVDSFAAFKQGMIGMSFNDIVAERIEQPEVRAAFEAGRVDDGYRFTNPIRVRLHRGPSAQL